MVPGPHSSNGAPGASGVGSPNEDQESADKKGSQSRQEEAGGRLAPRSPKASLEAESEAKSPTW